MAFDLKLYISGLGLFVPHGGKMHVLFPRTPPGHRHIAKIYFDPTRQPIEFDNVRWDLSTIVEGTPSPYLPPEVAHVARYAGKPGVHRDQLVRARQRNVLSHLIISAGAYACHNPGAKWNIAHHNGVEMTNWLMWHIPGIDDTQLDLLFVGLNGTPSRVEGPLIPVQTGGSRELQLLILHAPEADHRCAGPQIKCSDPEAQPAHHFSAYHGLFQNPATHLPFCATGPVGDPPCPDPFDLMGCARAASVYTCLLGQAPTA